MHDGKVSVANGHRGGRHEKRGGYSSSSKPASQLKPPPKGPAPGAKKPPAKQN